MKQSYRCVHYYCVTGVDKFISYATYIVVIAISSLPSDSMNIMCNVSNTHSQHTHGAAMKDLVIDYNETATTFLCEKCVNTIN